MIGHATADRIAMLLDELKRRGIPLHLLQPVIDWLHAETHLESKPPQQPKPLENN